MPDGGHSATAAFVGETGTLAAHSVGGLKPASSPPKEHRRPLPNRLHAAVRAVRARFGIGPLIAVGMAVAFLVAQLIPYGVTNPAKDVQPRWDSARTRALVVVACADCHSNRTRSAWYEHIVPVKWWIAGHVNDGRAALNFSAWDKPQGEGAAHAARTVANGSMPPSYYMWFGLHSRAKLSPADAKALIDGLAATIAADPPPGGTGTSQGG
jgi:mono/diheme cytochrome c family protein